MTGWIPWLLLLVYGAVFLAVAPRSRDAGGFYRGRDEAGRSPSRATLFATVFISWIFAKSVTNAANLAAAHGLPGAVAYGAWWLSIPVAGAVIVGLRSRTGARSLPAWVAGRYGRAAAGAFLLALMLRLYNEVWSNAAVVASYFGPRDSASFYAAALAFTLLTLLYTLKGGLRSSILTDAIQAGLFALFLAGVVAIGLPASAAEAGGSEGGGAGLGRMLASGSWTLRGGMDLLLVGLLQSVSYPFHDPVLTDRAFLASERATLKAFFWAGAAGFVAIVVFGGIGIPAHLSGLAFEDDAPRAVAAALGTGVLLLVNVVMLTSAGSTLDSTFSSLAKAVEVDGRRLLRAGPAEGLETGGSVGVGRWAMVAAAVVGNLPLFFGARILQATTVSGTMVLGLGPIFVLGLFLRAPPASFHLAFWTGAAVGVAEAAGWIPPALAIGDGRYAALLGANLWGLVLATGLFLLPWARRRWKREVRAETAAGAPSGGRADPEPAARADC